MLFTKSHTHVTIDHDKGTVHAEEVYVYLPVEPKPVDACPGCCGGPTGFTVTLSGIGIGGECTLSDPDGGPAPDRR